MSINLKDLGGQLLLQAAFTLAAVNLDLYVAPATEADSDNMLTHELCVGPDTYEVDMSTITHTVGTVAGIPQISWNPVDFSFTGPLTNSSGHLAVIGYRITMQFTGLAAPWNDTYVVYDELLPDGGITPADGNHLTLYPQVLLGNGTPG